MTFSWEKKAHDLGYRDSTAMLYDLIEVKRLTYEEASKLIGRNVYFKATRLGFTTGRKHGGPYKHGKNILIDMENDGVPVEQIVSQSPNLREAAETLGVSYGTLQRWRKIKDDVRTMRTGGKERRED